MTVRPLFPNDLLTLAYRLAGRDSGPGRPRTIELRRAVSTAYYALFHGWTGLRRRSCSEIQMTSGCAAHQTAAAATG